MKNYKYDGSRRFNIKGFDCGDTGEFKERHEAIREFTDNLEKINEYQQKLFAEGKEGIIFVFQAMDAAGKDGAVRAVLSCLSPQGVSEHSFKVPSAEENRHDYLWRFWDALPEKGSISIFNRSYYEDVLVQKIHKIYEKNKYADRIDMDSIIANRYEQISNFEKYLWENSIRVVKIFLNVSKEEQARRFISRIDTPKKNWKFSSGDIDEREYWDDYMDAYETCINRTARKNTPWYVVPADHKWYARLVISRIILDELRNMDPKWPVLDNEEKEKLESYRDLLIDQTTLKEEKETGKKLKPSDIAVGIALKKDREALSEKKFRKQLKKSVFENFSERFGVSEETQSKLGKIYLDFEELEANAEAENIDTAKSFYKEKKAPIEDALHGLGKEAKKLFESYKKTSHALLRTYKAGISLAYAKYEEQLGQFMAEYEIAVAADAADPEAAIDDYTLKVKDAYEANRAAMSEMLADTTAKLAEIADEYTEIAKGFHVEKVAEVDKEFNEETPAEICEEAEKESEAVTSEVEEASESLETENGEGENA